MQDWIQYQNWSEELWVVSLVAAVVIVSLLAWGYGRLHR